MNQTENLGMNNGGDNGGVEIYFFDTYALIEIIKGNNNFKKYINSLIITTIFNIAELNYNLKKEMKKDLAEEYTKDYFDFIVNVTLNDIKEAMDLKTKNRKLSIPDAIGYTIAKRYKVKFLTGDEDFRNFQNVEFVKK
ncbi:MAG: PIN domain-containing protein [Nanoarchaeota archaeon]|mgnify:FL=1